MQYFFSHEKLLHMSNKFCSIWQYMIVIDQALAA